jgi:hypothetical protein
MLGLAWKVLVPLGLFNFLWIAAMIKLPVHTLLQWALVLVGNVAAAAVALTLMGRAAKRYAAQRGVAVA